jgi:hypothetical protein
VVVAGSGGVVGAGSVIGAVSPVVCEAGGTTGVGLIKKKPMTSITAIIAPTTQ